MARIFNSVIFSHHNLLIRENIIIPLLNHVAGIKYFAPPKDYSHIEIPEKRKLNVLLKVPYYPSNIRPPKMNKCLKYIRGPELFHNTLLHEQYGIIALQGGRLKHGHLEMIRNTLSRKIDQKRMFLVWRIDAPWQSVTKKSQGARMGGGKGSIHHYVTPIKANRVIVELGGKCDYEEVRGLLSNVASLLPFKAMAVSHKILTEMAEKEKQSENNNINTYTLKYMLQNNIQNCRKDFRKLDITYFGKYT